MALFGSKKKTEKEVKAVKTVKKPVAPKNASGLLKGDYTGVIVRPHITEKASLIAEKNVYAFEVTKDADKKMVTAAIKAIYNVIPQDVRFVRMPGKAVFVRGKIGKQASRRKAYIALKAGDKIEFV